MGMFDLVAMLVDCQKYDVKYETIIGRYFYLTWACCAGGVHVKEYVGETLYIGYVFCRKMEERRRWIEMAHHILLDDTRTPIIFLGDGGHYADGEKSILAQESRRLAYVNLTRGLKIGLEQMSSGLSIMQRVCG